VRQGADHTQARVMARAPPRRLGQHQEQRRPRPVYIRKYPRQLAGSVCRPPHSRLLGTFWVLYNIRKKLRNFVENRQRHLLNPIHSASAQANTVLITGVPRWILDEEALAQLFQPVPGGVKKVWLNLYVST
jgi:hypothetical protein